MILCIYHVSSFMVFCSSSIDDVAVAASH